MKSLFNRKQAKTTRMVMAGEITIFPEYAQLIIKDLDFAEEDKWAIFDMTKGLGFEWSGGYKKNTNIYHYYYIKLTGTTKMVIYIASQIYALRNLRAEEATRGAV